MRARFVFALLALGCSDTQEPVPPSSAGTSAGGMASAGTGGAAGGGGAASGGAGSAGASGSATSGAAGTGGMSTGGSGGAGGMSGSGGTSGAAGSSGAAAVPSAGCQKPAGQALGEWVEQPKLPVNGKDRQWWLWLPEGYDPARAYPVVFTFHGCGGPTNFIPMEKVAGKDAIVVRGTGVTQDGCWTYSGAGDDVKFFDAMLAELEAKRCVDTSRVFSTGYSSGAWLTNTLECARGDKLRATGTVSGGVVGDRGTCKGKFARLFVHDAGDMTNKFVEHGNVNERKRVLEQNHCSAGDPVPEAPEPCARYQGCDAGYPVIMCQTEGKGHDRQDALAMAAFWSLFESL